VSENLVKKCQKFNRMCQKTLATARKAGRPVGEYLTPVGNQVE
jgi:hypothetical protein